MLRRPPRYTQSRSSAASDVYKRQADAELGNIVLNLSQSEDDFDYEIDSDLGNVEFDGVSMENFVICNKASGKMKLDSSMGNIEIYFEQD